MLGIGPKGVAAAGGRTCPNLGSLQEYTPMAYDGVCDSLRPRSLRLRFEGIWTMRAIARSRWHFCSVPRRGRLCRAEQDCASCGGHVPGRGKRGGVRLIYYWEPDSQTFYMLYLYAKNEQGDLTSEQLKVLAKLVRGEFK